MKREWLHLLEQSTSKIRNCIRQLSDAQIWWRPLPELNSIGNLMLHLAGNLQQWAVNGVQDVPDHRDRQAEFDANHAGSGEQLFERLCRIVEAASDVIRDLSGPQLVASRDIQGFTLTVLGALQHTIPHFVGHTHQIVLLTRMQLGKDYGYHWTPELPRGKVPL